MLLLRQSVLSDAIVGRGDDDGCCGFDGLQPTADNIHAVALRDMKHLACMLRLDRRALDIVRYAGAVTVTIAVVAAVAAAFVVRYFDS